MGNDFCTMENNCCIIGKDVVIMGDLHCTTVNNLCAAGKNLCNVENSFVFFNRENSSHLVNICCIPGHNACIRGSNFCTMENMCWDQLGSSGLAWDHLG